MTDAIIETSAAALIEAMRSGEVSAVETTSAYLARIEAREPMVRAFAHLDPAAALAAAVELDAQCARGEGLGALHGLPVAVKDIIDTADMPTAFGAARLVDRRPNRDAKIVERLRKAGALVLGKAVTSQFALFAPGPTCNPRDPARTPGGSSSGSAAAVAAGFAPIALGTQTNGSIVRPASYCGVVGFKPSLGVLPRTGILRHCDGVDHPGVFARSVEDAALVVDALAGEDPEDAGSRELPGSLTDAARAWRAAPRLAWIAGPYTERAALETRTAFERFIRGLPTSVDVITLDPEFAQAEAAMNDLMCAGFAESLGEEIDGSREDAPQVLLETLAKGRALSAVRMTSAWTLRNRLRARIIDLLSPYDAALTFAARGEAPLAAEGTGDPIFATLWSLIGAPAYSLPLLSGPNGLPLGVQVVAKPGADAALTRAAAWLERVNIRI